MSRVRNPHGRVDFLVRSRVGAGWAAWAWRWSPLVGVALALPWLVDDLYTFLELRGALRAQGASALLLRLALLLAAWLGLGTFDQAVRGPDRGVVDLHPILPAPYVRALLARAARGAAPMLVTALVCLAPTVRDPALFAGGAVLLAGAWAAGLTLGLGVNLAAPALAARPAVAPLLDAVRGTNPRAQAAVIWAPGVALGLTGLAILAGNAGLEAALTGRPLGWAALALPWAAAAFGARLVFVDADTLARIPAVLGEIDSSYAAVEAAEEGRRVYLEWVVRLAPAPWRPELLRVLRQGWRAERGWLGASFVGAALLALSGWSDGAPASRTLVLAAALLGGVGLLGPRLRARDPAWLALVHPAVGRVPALAAALFGWSQVLVLGAVAPLLVRQGLGAAGEAALRLELVAAGMALAGARLPGSGYVLAAVALGAAGVWR